MVSWMVSARHHPNRATSSTIVVALREDPCIQAKENEVNPKLGTERGALCTEAHCVPLHCGT